MSRPRLLRGNFTANSMAIAVDMLGLGFVGDGLIPAAYEEEKDAAAARAGTLAVSLAERGVTARSFLDRRALENAMAGSSPAAARRTASCTSWRSRARAASS